MPLYLLDDTLSVEVFFEETDREYCDNICIRFWESCPEDEKIFNAGETNIYLTVEEACKLAQYLLAAVKNSSEGCQDSP